MEIKYVYTQKRREFGAPCRFVDVGPHLLVDIEPNEALYQQYVQMVTTEKATLRRSFMSGHEVNTETHPCESRGICHEEGGWPADVDHRDEDQVARFKKKIEKDDNYIATVKVLAEQVEKLVMQNNAIDIYQEYFSNVETHVKEPIDEQLKVLCVYRDHNMISSQRTISCVSWSSDCQKIVASYSPLSGSQELEFSLDSYVWDIDNPITPSHILKPHVPLSCVEFSPWNNNVVIGGYDNGQIALWDLCKSDRPVQLSSVVHGHTDSVSTLKWINSKSCSEFFSASTDGKVMSWDAQNIFEPTYVLETGGTDEGAPFLQNYPITCLEYDPTVHHRFMLGCDEGTVIVCNRCIKAPDESILSIHHANFGPVLSLARNPFLPKLFMVTNAWTIQVWSDDETNSALLTLRADRGYFTDSAWCLSRPSVIFATKTNGQVEIWDILKKQHEPISSLKLEDNILSCVRPSPGSVKLACGSAISNLYILELPQYSKTTENDKALLTSMIESDLKREKILEPKSRDQRIREAEAIEKAAREERLKEMVIDPSWAPEDKGNETYAQMTELELSSGFLNLEELEMDAERCAEELHIEHEYGEKEFLVELERTVNINQMLLEVLMKVTADIESDNSKFPYKSLLIDEEFGEDEYLEELKEWFKNMPQTDVSKSTEFQAEQNETQTQSEETQAEQTETEGGESQAEQTETEEESQAEQTETEGGEAQAEQSETETQPEEAQAEERESQPEQTETETQPEESQAEQPETETQSEETETEPEVDGEGNPNDD